MVGNVGLILKIEHLDRKTMSLWTWGRITPENDILFVIEK